MLYDKHVLSSHISWIPSALYLLMYSFLHQHVWKRYFTPPVHFAFQLISTTEPN